MHDSLISVLCFLLKQIFIAANNCLRPQLNMEVFEVLMPKANTILTCRCVRLALVTLYDKDHFIYILTFLKYVLLRLEEAGLEILQNADHEL